MIQSTENKIRRENSPVPSLNELRVSRSGSSVAHFACVSDSVRFQQLLDLAVEGKEEAVGDLWREFAFAFPTPLA